MFHTDISFTTKEKAVQFGEDAKNFMISYKDALDFLRERAYHDFSKENYIANAKNLVQNLKSNNFIYTKLFDLSKSYLTPLTPTFQSNDQKFHLAKYAYGFYTKHFIGQKDEQKYDFDSLSKKLDEVYDEVSKQ